VRQFLTSGDAGQAVSDDGTFAQLFVDVLKGERRADGNNDGYITASEIGAFLDAKMSNYTKNRQTPRYGKLRSPEFDKGDFVFLAGRTSSTGGGGSRGGGGDDDQVMVREGGGQVRVWRRQGDFHREIADGANGTDVLHQFISYWLSTPNSCPSGVRGRTPHRRR
jgi:hypothetical protein